MEPDAGQLTCSTCRYLIHCDPEKGAICSFLISYFVFPDLVIEQLVVGLNKPTSL